MKKTFLLTVFAFAMAVTASAQIDNFNSNSPDWVRTPARNAATDAADIVAYNPAGLTSLKEGFHINAGNLSLFRKPTHSYTFGGVTKEFKQLDADPLVPNLYLAYHKKDWAFFTGVYIAGGGATVNYDVGSVTTEILGYGALAGAAAAGADYMSIINPSLKASSYYLTIPLGVTYKFGEFFSASFGGRMVSATNKVESSITLTNSSMGLPDQTLGLDAEYSASGFGWVYAINAASSDVMNFSLRYETQVDLEFETKVNTDDMHLLIDGDKNHRDLPSVLAAGIAVNASPKMKLFVDADFYFQSSADWDTAFYENNPLDNSKLAGNAAMYSIAAQYAATEKINVGLGTSYTIFNYKNQTGYYNSNIGAFEVIQDDNCTLNLGVRYSFTEKISGTVAYMTAMYAKDKKLNQKNLGTPVTMNNSANVLGIGVNLSF